MRSSLPPLLAAAMFAAAPAGCPAPPSTDTPRETAAASPAPAQPPMRPLPESAHLLTIQDAQTGEPEVRVLRDRAAWDAAWRQLQAGLDAGPAPAVDFAREMVVLIATGQKSSGGHSVRVDGTSAAADGALVLHVTVTAPGPGCMATMALSSPVDVVRVPRTATVRTAMRTVAEPC